MRSVRSLFLLLSAFAVAGIASAAEPAPKATPEAIQKLVKQLGDENFARREAAAKRLAEIGPDALPALREAKASGDAEVKKAADKLITEISTGGEAKARERFNKKLADYQGAQGGQVLPVTDDAVSSSFPGHYFYVLRFRQFPVARAIPAPLKSNNVFVVRPGDKVDLLTDAKSLERFFQEGAAPVAKFEQAKTLGKAWLRLSQEFHQDGFYQFNIPDEFKVEGTKDLPPSKVTVIGKAVVNPQGGNKGDIEATLVFEKGKLASVKQDAKLFPGPRPICQATKLLDADPIVRAMAEQTILVMGRNAKSYLDEQRAKANPDLQKAIDRMWQRIVDEGR